MVDKLNQCNKVDVKMEETVGRLVLIAVVSMILIIFTERINLYFF